MNRITTWVITKNNDAPTFSHSVIRIFVLFDENMTYNKIPMSVIANDDINHVKSNKIQIKIHNIPTCRDKMPIFAPSPLWMVNYKYVIIAFDEFLVVLAHQ